MSRPASTGPTQQPLQLSALERPAFAHLFSLADTTKSGLITGDAAVEFFSKANPPLPPATLGLIWSLSDTSNNGFLTAPSFSIALRLIAHAQRGESVDELAIHKSGAPPNFNGVTLPSQAAPNSSSTFNPPTSNQSSSSNPNYIPISPADRSRYMRIFANSNPNRGLIDGDKAKEIFVKSKLPFDKLGAIWNLADTHARGSLDATDFILGMHFIQHTMSGRLNSIPAALPPGLYEQASNGTPISNVHPNHVGMVPGSPIAAQSTGGSQGGISRQMTGSNIPIPRQLTGQQAGIPRQLTGQQTIPAGYLSPSQSNSNFAQAQAQGRGNWSVTPADQAKSDRFFDGLDTEKSGALEGQTVVPFFMQSGLGEQVLALIWDLSDITQSGSLSREEFAVAMYLINGKLAGKEPPQELPENLVPPSLRGKNLPEAVNPQESDTQRDLFSLMDDDPAPLPISTTSAFNQPTPQASSAPPPPPARQASTNTRGPFDDDFFGSPAPAAAPAASAASPAPIAPNGTGNRSQPPAPTSAFIGDSGAELGNKQLQLDNTTKAVSSLQTQRSDLSTAVSTGASSLAEIESRLAQARATHESESKLVSELQARQRAQSESLKTSREELIRAESDLSALKAEKDEVEQAVMRDREDVRDLQRRMTAVQSETSELKIQLEKLKKEARQKKGMVAIGKKQLATAEGEHEKVGQEIKAVESGEMEEEAPVAPTASAVEVKAVSPKSPTGALSPSSVRSLNPFDRIGSGATEERSQSPSISTVGLGAGAGAALGLAGAAAVHGASTTSEDREATQGESTHQPSSSSGFDDAFGAPPASNTNDISAVPAFDDEFGSGFDATSAPSKEATAEGGNATAFDDAFADFGSQPKEAAAEAEPSQPPVSDGFEESFAPVATSAATQETEEPSASTSIPTSQPVTAPEVEEPASSSAEQPTPTQDDSDDEDDVPLSETSAAKRKSRLLGASELSQSSTPAQQDEQEDDSSDDEANEPEDLDSQPNRLRGASDATETQATALQQEREAPLPPAKSSNQASDRFPELPNPAEEPSMMMPGAIQTSDPQELTLPEEGESREAPGGLSSSTSTGSMLSSIPGDGRTSRMTNDGDDAFHDAFDEAPASSEPAVPGDNSNAFLAPASGAALASSGAPSTFSTSSQQGSEVGHERFSTAAVGDDELGSSAATSTSPLSSMTIPAPAGTTPASTLAAKTRRAPPPAPVRNPTSLTPTGGAGSGSAQLANDPFAPSNPAQSNQQASFDDFDSAFEDLGATSGTQSSNATGFDDAFGADSDFDFVPSFAQQSSGAPHATSSNKDNAFDGLGQSQQAAATNSNSFGGFDDFDSAFNPDGATSNAAAPAAGPTSSNSTSGSGFSFEDAFDPSQASAQASAPAAGAPPSLPARGVEAAPSQSATTAPQSDNALPDDAQQVKQLCGMGFTRSKVIKALEKSNYRTEKALEKLLAEA